MVQIHCVNWMQLLKSVIRQREDIFREQLAGIGSV